MLVPDMGTIRAVFSGTGALHATITVGGVDVSRQSP